MHARMLSLALVLCLLMSLSACTLEKEAEPTTVRPAELPEYVAAEAARTAEKILSHQSEGSFSLAWLSDLHVGYPYEALEWKADETSVAQAGQGLNALGEYLKLDLIVLGGDLANGGPYSSAEDTRKELEAAAEYMRPATFFTPTLYLVGNHDDAPYRATDERLSPEELYAHFGRKSVLAGAVTNEEDPLCNYGYLDFPLEQMRVIYLDTNDKTDWPSTGWVEGDSASAYLDACHVSARQLDWFANVALDFSDKEKPANWDFLVVSHVPLDLSSGVRTYTDAASGKSFEYNTDYVIRILTEYLRGNAGSLTLNGETAEYDFSDLKEKANLCACIHGHRHNAEYRAYGPLEIPAIGCPNVRDGRERAGGDGNTYLKTPETGDSTAFSVITIDRENGKIYADVYGAGPDREWELRDLGQIGYTNLVGRAVDPETGELLDGCGYRDNVRLSTLTGLPEQAGYVTTGVMQWRKEPGDFDKLDPIYIRGVDLDTSDNYVRMALITNAGGEEYKVNIMIKGGEDGKWHEFFTIEELDERYYRLTPREEAMSSWYNVCHFMLCAVGSGENLTVTAGEKIS